MSAEIYSSNSELRLELKTPFNNGLIELKCFSIGQDYQLIISGGKAHVGAVAVGVCYDPQQAKTNVSQIAVFGHREDELAARVAKKVSQAVCATVAVTAGIHFTDLSQQEIQQILSVVDKLTDQLILKLGLI